MNSESEFYVGYLPAPASLKTTIRRVAAGVAVLTAAVAAILVAGQQPFAASTFEFRQYRDFRGVLLAEPYPALAIARQGAPWLLVRDGKHGADALSALAGHEVRLTGERIFRGGDGMIEAQLPVGQVFNLSPAQPSVDLGRTRLTGEVVDSKCYYGVMNPGSGKVHRDCAVRCISGGIPPAFLVRDAAGEAATFLLANWKPELLQHIGEPVTLNGRIVRSYGRLVFYAE
jgi:hypothetical protein